MSSTVTTTAPAAPADVAARYAARLAFETDCWDVYDAMSRASPISCCSMCAARSFMPPPISPARSTCRMAR